ncbi:hypothetical protein EYF80_046750 [Liparis tanakae]|uniref:Uncharacterized protein n=1 Tax=Liparis tanakae TaxID=230148 RepID=A0A4Z2FPZ9_9TELE|nr:hypothetical protein EYF80_046750 [Liparis tanakae]
MLCSASGVLYYALLLLYDVTNKGSFDNIRIRDGEWKVEAIFYLNNVLDLDDTLCSPLYTSRTLSGCLDLEGAMTPIGHCKGRIGPRRRVRAIRRAICFAADVFSGTGGGALRGRPLGSASSPKTSYDSSNRARGRSRTSRSSSRVTGGVVGDPGNAEESEWRRRVGPGIRTGRRGVCRERRAATGRGEAEPDLDRSFQPRGSRPVTTDVWTGGGEEQEEEEEEEEEKKEGEPKAPVGGQEWRWDGGRGVA